MPFMSRILKYLVALILLLGLALMAYMLTDVPVNTNAIAFEQQMTQYRQDATPAQINSYYYHLGMGYQTESLSIVNIIETGKVFSAQMNAIYADDSIPLSQKDDMASGVYDNFSKVNFSNEASFCALALDNLKNDDCIDPKKATPAQLRQGVQEAQISLSHYQNFLSLAPSVDISIPSPYTPIPNWQILRRGQRVAGVQYLLLAQSGQTQSALEYLLRDFAVLRTHFAHSDTLLAKIVWQRMLTEQLNIITLVKMQYGLQQAVDIDPIVLLNQQEASLKQAYVHEVASYRYMMQHIIEDDMSIGQHILHRLTFKPQQTLNIYANYYKQLTDDDEIPASEFASFVDSDISCDSQDLPLIGFGLNNMTGRLIANIAIPDYSRYKHNIWSINNLINITNYILSNRETPLKNTYAPAITEVKITPNNVCMAAPKQCSEGKLEKVEDCLALISEPK